MRKLSGSCLCNKVKIEVPDDFEYMETAIALSVGSLLVQTIRQSVV